MKKDERYFYPAIFSRQGDKIKIYFPDLDVATEGDDEVDALLNARDLLGGMLLGLEKNYKDFPVATSLWDVQTEKGERAVLVDVFMPSVRAAKVNKTISRTVTVPAWLNAVALEYGLNFSQILQKGLKEELHL